MSPTKYQIITFIMNVSDEWSPLTSSSPKYNITSMEYSSNKWHWNLWQNAGTCAEKAE
jgi:hypothetical protein